MGFRDWMGKYIISIGPSQDALAKGEINAAEVSLTGQGKVQDSSFEVKPESLKPISGINVPFEKLFETANIIPPLHKFTVEKVAEMLRNSKLGSLPKESKAAAVLVALDAQGVKITEIIYPFSFV